MASLEMNGPFSLDSGTIDDKVTKTSPGNYALGKKRDDGKFLVLYVGRSDDDLNDRLKKYVNNPRYLLFKFSYASSPKAAYEKECRNYHDFDPPDNDVHPRKPDGQNWKCPVCDK